MSMASTPPPKNTNWHTGLKRKIQKLVAYKKTHLIDKNKHCLRVKAWKISQANGPENRKEKQYLYQIK
jgi:hypothetical protein